MRFIFRIVSAILVFVAVANVSMAQGGLVQLTGWRATLDSQLAELSMPRTSHIAIQNIMQQYEQQARIEEAKHKTETLPPSSPSPPQ